MVTMIFLAGVRLHTARAAAVMVVTLADTLEATPITLEATQEAARPAHSAHHGEHSEHHESHIADHGHFRHFDGIHHIIHHRFGGGPYCLTDSFYYDETGVRHCCNTSGQPCFPLPSSQKEIAE